MRILFLSLLCLMLQFQALTNAIGAPLHCKMDMPAEFSQEANNAHHQANQDLAMEQHDNDCCTNYSSCDSNISMAVLNTGHYTTPQVTRPGVVCVNSIYMPAFKLDEVWRPPLTSV